MEEPIEVTVTGGSGNIGQPLLNMMGGGGVFGGKQPMILRLLHSRNEVSEKNLRKVVEELKDCAFPLIHSIIMTPELEEAFEGAQYVFLGGAVPRRDGMSRADLLEKNASIFVRQGQALNDYADMDVKVLVYGNPANTNALIAQQNAPDLDPSCFTAMTYLDHTRAYSLLAEKLNVRPTDISGITIWGNHSKTQVPDLFHATVKGRPVMELVDMDWYLNEYIPRIQNRGTEILNICGTSSSFSAANAAGLHMKKWVQGTDKGEWVSMAVPSTGAYGIKEGLFFSVPVTCKNGQIHVVEDLELPEELLPRLQETHGELVEEWQIAMSFIPEPESPKAVKLPTWGDDGFYLEG